jgi:hypothetical protein
MTLMYKKVLQDEHHFNNMGVCVGVGDLVICVLVFTVCTVFLYNFVYMYIFTPICFRPVR